MTKTFIAFLIALLLWSAYAYFSAENIPFSSQNEAPTNSSESSYSRAPPRGLESYISRLNDASIRQESNSSLYNYIPTPGVNGRNELDRIYVQDLPITPKSAAFVHALFKRNISNDEKVALSRILGKLFTSEDITGFNSDILLDLRSLANDNNTDVSKSGVLALSRIGYLPGIEAFLENSFSKGILSSDEYYGELAHLLLSSPSTATSKIIDLIVSSNNEYAIQILSSHINSESFTIKSQSNETIYTLQKLLKDHEPLLEDGIGIFSYSGIVEYGNWLQAFAKTEHAISGESETSITIKKLLEPGTDPRKVMGYLLLPEGSDILLSAKLGSPSANLIANAVKYANQFPTNESIQMGLLEIKNKIENQNSKTNK